MVAGGDLIPKASQVLSRLIAGVLASSMTRSGACSGTDDTSRESSTHSTVIPGSPSTSEQMSLRLPASGSTTKTRMGSTSTWTDASASTPNISGTALNYRSPVILNISWLGTNVAEAQSMLSDLACTQFTIPMLPPKVTAGGVPRYFLSCSTSTVASTQFTARFAMANLCCDGMRSTKANHTTPWAKA